VPSYKELLKEAGAKSPSPYRGSNEISTGKSAAVYGSGKGPLRKSFQATFNDRSKSKKKVADPMSQETQREAGSTRGNKVLPNPMSML